MYNSAESPSCIVCWLPIAGQHILRSGGNHDYSGPDSEPSVTIVVWCIGVVCGSLVECEFLYNLARS